MDQEGDNIKIKFQAILPAEISASLRQIKAELPDSETTWYEQKCHPMIGPRPDSTWKDFYFPSEVQELSFRWTLVKTHG